MSFRYIGKNSVLFPINFSLVIISFAKHNRRGHRRTWSQIVSHNHAALHHKFYSLHFSDVLEGISGDCDDVGELAQP